jgi:hypothetical protein
MSKVGRHVLSWLNSGTATPRLKAVGRMSEEEEEEDEDPLLIAAHAQGHGPNSIKTPNPKMSFLLVFDRVYRLEIQVNHVGIFDPSCELASF